MRKLQIQKIIEKITQIIQRVMRWIKEKLDPIINKIKSRNHKIDKDMLSDFRMLNRAFSELHDEFVKLLNGRPGVTDSDGIIDFAAKIKEFDEKYEYVKSTPQYIRFFENSYTNKNMITIKPSDAQYLFSVRETLNKDIETLEKSKDTFKKLLYEDAEGILDEDNDSEIARTALTQYLKMTNEAIGITSKHVEAINKVIVTLKIDTDNTK